MRRLGMLQQIQTLLGGLRRVDGDVDGAQQQGGEVGDRPLRPVLAEDGDAIALANAPGLQLARGSEDLGLQLGGGDRCPGARLARQHHAVAVALYHREENIVEGPDVHGFRVNAQLSRVFRDGQSSQNQNVSCFPGPRGCDL